METVVISETIPTDKGEKLIYNAERLTGSAISPEYHVMIEEGLEYSYVSTGLALILLHVPYHDPGTLRYFLCEPNLDVDAHHSQHIWQPKTARKEAQAQLHIWQTSFELTRSQIPTEELRQNPPGSEYQGSKQLDKDKDHNLTPWNIRGSFGVPFKVTCAKYGYTIVGKGTSTYLWEKKVSREAEIYRILRKAQGSAVPVFLGTITLDHYYFVHGAGRGSPYAPDGLGRTVQAMTAE
ncbi:hypothetical protein FQN57_004236 [Myotisia sp. PD_48]|nr:hypothetical protein FQN57_004236 [Myotisia sp. PD_48]